MKDDAPTNLVSLDAHRATRTQGPRPIGDVAADTLHRVVSIHCTEGPEVLALMPRAHLKRGLRERRKELTFERGYIEGVKRWIEVASFHVANSEIDTMRGVAETTLAAARGRCADHCQIIRALRIALQLQQLREPQPPKSA